MSPSRAPFFSCAYCFQTPASQAKLSVAEQIQLAVKAGLELGACGIQVQRSNRSAALPPLVCSAFLLQINA